MTGELDLDLDAAAVELISEFGKSITLTRVTNGAYDPTTSSNTQSQAAETTIALIEDYKPFELANQLAVVGDKKLTLAASGFAVPALTDFVSIDGVQYSIAQVGTIYSGELPALYILQARKT